MKQINIFQTQGGHIFRGFVISLPFHLTGITYQGLLSNN